MEMGRKSYQYESKGWYNPTENNEYSTGFESLFSLSGVGKGITKALLSNRQKNIMESNIIQILIS